ncbi:MAG: PilZ domain-containing protein [Polyangiaceae bacterium]
MSGRGKQGSMNGTERRSPVGQRVQFEALVAVGGAEGGAGFEAESLDVSAEGMRLRTAYLPTIGDRLVCRFDGLEGEIIVEGEVIWATEQQKGGEFAVRFLDLDAETREILKELCFVGGEGASDKPAEDKSLAGTRVRLHIEGLGSPMKARVRSGNDKEVLVGSSLEFLKIGRTVELEDVDHQSKREGFVDTVKVEVDPESSVPQLVVSLRFEAAAKAEAPKTKPGIGPAPVEAKPKSVTEPAAPHASARPIVVDTTMKPARQPSPEDAEAAGPGTVRAQGAADATATEDEEDDDAPFGKSKLRVASEKAKAMTSQAVSKIGPAFTGLGNGARGVWSKVQSSLSKRKADREEAKRAAAPRRVTAPPPSGALKSSGRKLVRDREENTEMEPDSIHIPTHSKRRAAIGAVVGIGLIAAIFGVVKATSGGSDAKTAGAAASQSAQAAGNNASGTAMGNVPLFGATPLSTTEQVQPPPPPATAAANAPPSAAQQAEEGDDDKTTELAKEWGKGEVKKPNTLKIKMDGDVEGIRGEETDDGFVLHVPGHKAMGSTSSLAHKDKHIQSLDVVAHDDETEITVKFRGEPPGYKAKVNGKKIEIQISGDAGNKVAAAPKPGNKKKPAAPKAPAAKKKPGKH